MKKSTLFVLFTFLVILLLPVEGMLQSLDWVKTGQSIVPNNDGAIGDDVSINGDGSFVLTCSRGLPCSTAPNNSIQLTQAYTWNGTEWNRKGRNLDPISHYLSWSVDVDRTGNTIVAGETCASLEGYILGGVKAFEWNGNDWKQKGNDIFPIEDIRDKVYWEESSFGWQVEISNDGNVIVVGAPEYEIMLGAIKAFSWDGQKWIEMGSEIIGKTASARLGTSLALNGDGNRIVMNGSFPPNSVLTYDWNGNDWIEVGTPLTGGGITSTGGCFGCALSLSEDGNTLAVGQDASLSPNHTGTVKVYRWSGNSWVQKGGTLRGDELGDNFGSSVSLNSSGNVLAIEAEQLFNFSSGENGLVKIFIWDQNSWKQLGKTIRKDEGAPGGSVSLNKVGNRVAIGSPGEQIYGAVHVYTFDGTITSTKENSEESNFQVYPNPTKSGTNTLETEVYDQLRVKILDLNGKTVFDQEYRNTKQVTLSYPDQPGVYLVCVTDKRSGVTNTVKVLRR